MLRRPVVWLLVLLALSGGWLVYDWRRDAPERLAGSDEGAPATIADPASTASAVERAGQETGPAAKPATAPSGTPAPATAPDPVVAVAPPSRERASDAQITDSSAQPVPAPAVPGEPTAAGPIPTAEQTPPPATGGSAADWRRLTEIAPGAGPAPGSAPPATTAEPPADVVETDPPHERIERAPAVVEPPAAAIAAASPDRLPAPSDRSETPSAAPGAPDPIRPSFDIVRVERDGRAVVAGRAAPGAEVELRAGDRVLDRVRASQRGEWVATPLEPLPPGGQELTLAARGEDGVPVTLSEQMVVVARPEPPPPQPAPVAASEPPPPQPAEVAAQAAPGEPVAVLLGKDGEASGRILQAPGRISSDGRLALLVLDYDHEGQVRLSGEGPPGAPVRVYVDNQPSAEVVVAQSGQWTTVLGQQLAPGNYDLRLDQLGSEGRPVARLETPFTRVRQPPVAGQAQVDYVIVQPGNSLWRIARRLFGDGFRYVHLYDANQTQIRDPDLIYPGQVFEVPAALGTAG